MSKPMRDTRVSRQVGARVLHLRTVRGMSRESMVRRLLDVGFEITAAGLGYVERDAVNVSVDFAMAASRALNVPFTDLVQLPKCAACNGEPPSGYTCNQCGAGHAMELV